ncbi:MAG: phosphoglycerate dehydrogenase [Candidatus Bathyarchaeia archaeon]
MPKVWWIEPLDRTWQVGKKMLEENGCEVFLGRFHSEAGKPYSEEEIIELGKDVNAILLIAREKITAKVLEELPKLSVIVKAGVGVDNIDVEAATRFGILVANTPVPADYIGVAEGAVARILALAKRLSACDRSVKQGLWLRNYDDVRGVYLRGKTLGIVGLGRIGSYVAKVMSSFGVKVLAYDPYVSKDKALLVDASLVDLDTLLSESDFVTLHAVLTPETKKMIGASQLRMMKKSAYLINTARGALVDEQALYKALREGWIAGAALDVFEEEPTQTQFSPPITGDSGQGHTFATRSWSNPRNGARSNAGTS